MHDSYYENIDLYLSGDCGEEELRKFNEHMKSCENCRREYELALEIKQAMCEMPKITPPADFAKALNDRLDREEARKPARLPLYKRYSALAACIVLIAVLGIDTAQITHDAPIEERVLPAETQGLDENTDISAAENTVLPQETEDVTAMTPAPAEAPASTDSETAAHAAVSETASAQPVSTERETIQTPAVSRPAAQANRPVQTTPEPAQQTEQQVTRAQSQETTPAQAPQIDPDAKPIASSIPSYVDEKDSVILATDVEKDYQITGLTLENLPVKKRDLAAEFALVQNPKTGTVIANPSTLASIEGIEITGAASNRQNLSSYAVGGGSISISAKDKEAVDDMLKKYMVSEQDDLYFFTGENFKIFTNEMTESGINFEERSISANNGRNIAFQLIIKK